MLTDFLAFHNYYRAAFNISGDMKQETVFTLKNFSRHRIDNLDADIIRYIFDLPAFYAVLFCIKVDSDNLYLIVYPCKGSGMLDSGRNIPDRSIQPV